MRQNTATPAHALPVIAFIGGGNMASAIIGGLIDQGQPASQIEVLEPGAEAREALRSTHGVEPLPEAGAALERAQVVVWAVKPQVFRDAAAQAGAHVRQALHLSVAAGIRCDSIVRWLGCERVARAMPNTPALVRKGMSALYARPAVSAAERQSVEAIMACTGEFLWVENEKQLDAVTALSGSGPAYVFYFLEAMVRAGVGMGLSEPQAYRLAVATFAGAAELARRSDEPPAVLRQRVTSKGGTTHAALQALEDAGVGASFEAAMHAAERRAHALGDAFGA
ncbi:pyrroline-5-carboxylate reductase [Verminephrobacter aporrectodeae subsp. tuberculatae]|uniref:pyrroline-5-carboxylate reductase n=1 Tax=Verminephrobacter aporrectodeae TaxID=1110389 RepID=UPI00224381F3|nr:pyrroline-5-carboxylate reductase [Verminephrobacter aporrectodeae]MCW8164364.1 pyrroline-5-carboxylate reductase [Verminephrobacter aporrectodeae subsp. tuberculatae]MCW8169824.1 pyrroline-5-carboxylate reductase [Verminephrobacter aporrectodeae subsp. tuberculatae]